MPAYVFASLLFVCGLVCLWCGRSLRKQTALVTALSKELKKVNGLLMESRAALHKATLHLDSLRNPLHFSLEPSAEREARQKTAPDPALVRGAFFSIERQPLFEITEDYARTLKKEGHRVFLHPFDPVEIEHFDSNGFQCWAVGGYRIEGVRYYTDLVAIPGLYLRKLLGKYNDDDLPK